MSIFSRFFRRKSPLTRLTNPDGMVYNKNTDRESAKLTDDAPNLNLVKEITALEVESLGGYFFLLCVAERMTPITVAIIVTKANRSPNVTYIDITSDSFYTGTGERNILYDKISPPFLCQRKRTEAPPVFIHLKTPGNAESYGVSVLSCLQVLL